MKEKVGIFQAIFPKGKKEKMDNLAFNEYFLQQNQCKEEDYFDNFLCFDEEEDEQEEYYEEEYQNDQGYMQYI